MNTETDLVGRQSTQVSLTHIKADQTDKRMACTVGLVLAIIFAASISFARTPLFPIPAFIPAYEAALFVIDGITAVLLLGQFWHLRLPILLVLAGAYMFDAAMVIPHSLGFPGVITPTGWLSGGPQTTAWMYMFWHGGFPLFLMGYVALGRFWPQPISIAYTYRFFWAMLIGVFSLTVSMTVLAINANDYLPALLIGNVYGPGFAQVVGTVWALSVLAFMALLTKRPYSILDLWLLVVMFAWIVDIALSAMLNGARFDLGFYMGRFYGLMSATFILAIMLLETNGLLDMVAIINQRIFDTTQDMILIVDGFGNFIRVSPSCYQIIGYNRRYMAGRNALEFICHEDLEHTRNEMKIARHSRQTRNFECRYQHKNGHLVTLWWTGVWSEPEKQYFFIGRDITERIEQQRSLRESEARLTLAAEIAGTGLVMANTPTEAGLTDARFNAIYGLGPEITHLTVADWLKRVHPEDRDRIGQGVMKAIFEDATYRGEFRIRRADNNEIRWVDAVTRIVRDRNGKFARYIGVHIDTTDKQHTEEQLRQSQKMEAIGNLTGGMAHDFNNILGVIIGCLDTALVQSDLEVQSILNEAIDAAMSASDLTKSLLAFARQQPLKPQKLQINHLISDFVRLLRRTLGEKIEIKLNLDNDLWPCIVDPVQLESALTNLATNARDAMPNGGRLIITTANRHLDSDYASMNAEVAAGDYTAIEVSDTGSGMTMEVVQRIFEPFYTTKDTGKGTGLGLAMVFGFIKQSNGHVSVYSEPGVGTTFRLYFPRVIISEEDLMVEQNPIRAITRGNGETVLVVEDNDRLRRVVMLQVKNLGYNPIESNGPDAALVLLQKHKVDILFTDIVMPGQMDGLGLAKHALQLWPDVRVLLTSGFPGGVKLDDELENNTVQLLSKPYRTDELAHMLQMVLQRPAPKVLPPA